MEEKANLTAITKHQFQVRPKLKIPKHIHGYNIIKLNE